MSDQPLLRAETVIAEVERLWDAPCQACQRPLLGHDVVLSLFLGSRDRPRCAACLAGTHAEDPTSFLARAREQIRRLDCYRAGWIHSDRRLEAASAWPEERLSRSMRMPPEDSEQEVAQAAAPDAPAATPSATEHCATEHCATEHCATEHWATEHWATEHCATAYWDAGDMGCGDLVLELRSRLLALEPAAVLEVRATDPGAPGDIPAWCRVTRNPLLHSQPPQYWIGRRPETTG